MNINENDEAGRTVPSGNPVSQPGDHTPSEVSQDDAASLRDAQSNTVNDESMTNDEAAPQDGPVPAALLTRLKKLFGRATLADCLKQGRALREARTHFPTTKGFIEWAKTELGLSTSWAAKLVQLAKNWDRIRDAAANLGLDLTTLTVQEAIDLAPSKPRKQKEEAAPQPIVKVKKGGEVALTGGNEGVVLAISGGNGGNSGCEVLAVAAAGAEPPEDDEDEPVVAKPSKDKLQRALLKRLEAAVEAAVAEILGGEITTDIELLGGRGVHSISLDTAVKVLIDFDLLKVAGGHSREEGE